MAITVPFSARSASYLASAGQVTFPFGWPVLNASDLKVTRTRAGVRSELALTTDYFVSGVGAQGGGDVILNAGSQALDLVLIEGALTPQRASNFLGGQPFEPDQLNLDLNRLAIMAQELTREAGRAIRRAGSDASSSPLLLPDSPLNALIGFGPDGDLKVFNYADFGGVEALRSQAVATGGASLNLNLAAGAYVKLTLAHAVSSLSVAGWPQAGTLGRLTLEVNQTGSFNISGWGGALWAGGPPIVSAGAGKRDLFMLHTIDAGATVFGAVIGQNYL